MKNLLTLARSSIGTKFAMALTGLGLLGFVLGHMLGNLQMFLGQDAINAYAAGLKSMPGLLWGARIGLLVCLGVHVAAAMKLTKGNQDARPVSYAKEQTIQASKASESMIYSGFLLLAYVFVIHLPHFTLHMLPDGAHFKAMSLDGAGRFDVYKMVVYGFSNWAMSAVYIVAMIGLGFHLSHGISSALQTLGLNHKSYNFAIKNAGPGLATLVAAGYIVIPLSVLLGVLKLPPVAAGG